MDEEHEGCCELGQECVEQVREGAQLTEVWGFSGMAGRTLQTVSTEIDDPLLVTDDDDGNRLERIEDARKGVALRTSLWGVASLQLRQGEQG